MSVKPTAIVYVPPEIDHDGLYAREGVIHIERRGYRFAGVLRDWRHVEHVLKQDTADIVVFARQEHRTAAWAQTGLRAEFVGDDTRELVWRRPTNAGMIPPERRADRVAEIIDGTGAIPAGLDPASIAAARRIARRLALRNG